MPAYHSIVACGKKNNASKHGAIPIHRLCRYRLSSWKETENEEADEKDEGDRIDCHSVSAQREAGLGQGLLPKPAQEERPDGQKIGAEQGRNCQGDDGVQRYARAEIDESDGDSGEEGYDDSVERDIPAGRDL